MNPLLEDILNPTKTYLYVQFLSNVLERCYYSTNIILDVLAIRVLPGTPCFRSYDDEEDVLLKEMIPTLNCLSAAHSAPLAPKH